jgi:hypothetical protein
VITVLGFCGAQQGQPKRTNKQNVEEEEEEKEKNQLDTDHSTTQSDGHPKK